MSTKTLDTSDLDRHMGVPIQPGRMVEPVANNDIRRWAQGMHYPNRLHYDRQYAAEGRWGKLVAPQSFAVTMDCAHGSAPACVGRIPDSHLLFGGDEWWFNGPRVFGGDVIRNERIPFDYSVKDTKLAGPTCFQRGDNFYYNAQGELIAKQRSTTIRYLAEAARETGVVGAQDDPEWTDAEIKDLEERKFAWVQMLHDLGHGRRYWDDVKVGDQLPERVFGPHTVASLTTEWRAYLFTIWGGTHRRTDLDIAELGFVEEMAGHENDPVMEAINPELTDGAYYGPSRGHLFPRWARFIGMPRAYGYGASMGAWILDYLAGWAGEWGMVVHSAASYRGPAFTGDITIMTADVIDKRVDEEGRPIIQVNVKMTNQLGAIMATGKAEIQLPTREK